MTHRPARSTVTALLSAVAAAAAGASLLTGPPASLAATSGNLVDNAAFTDGRTGWGTGGDDNTLLTVAAGPTGNKRAVLTARSRGRVRLSDRSATVPGTNTAGTGYVAKARVRNPRSRATVRGSIYLTETDTAGTGAVATKRTRFALSGTRWTTVTLGYTSRWEGSTLDVGVTAPVLPNGRRLLVDNVRLRRETVPQPEQRSEPSGWTLQYQTGFTSLAGWTVYNNQTQNNDNSINLAKNVTAAAGGLTLLGRRESGYSRPFTSGELVGKGEQVVPNHFRAEVVGTFEDVSGIWPCLLWFRPNNASDGEIDVMEWMGGMWTGDQKRVAITMHNEYGATQDSIKRPLTLKANTWFDPAAEHTYTVEKVPGSITVWVDGRQISRFTAADKAWWNRIMEVPGRTWYPRLTLQIGAGSATKVVPDPAAGFASTKVSIRSLKLWRLS